MVGSPVSLICSLFQEVLELGRASLLEVALLIAVVALAARAGTLPRVSTSTFQGCNETGHPALGPEVRPGHELPGPSGQRTSPH